MTTTSMTPRSKPELGGRYQRDQKDTNFWYFILLFISPSVKLFLKLNKDPRHHLSASFCVEVEGGSGGHRHFVGSSPSAPLAGCEIDMMCDVHSIVRRSTSAYVQCILPPNTEPHHPSINLYFF
jgi:hypothetical protein